MHGELLKINLTVLLSIMLPHSPIAKWIYDRMRVRFQVNIFSFFERTWHKETDAQVLQKISAHYFHTTPQKKFANFWFFLNTHRVIKHFANFSAFLKWRGQGLFKNVCFIIFWTYVLCKHLTFKLDFDKKFDFLQIWFFLTV